MLRRAWETTRQLADRVAKPSVILVTGWVLFLVYAFPGFMSYDSTYQLSQARHLEPVTDWHPPLMTMIWRNTDRLISGPFPMLAIQSLSFLFATYVVMRHVVSHRAAAIVAAVMLLLPQNQIVLAVIWKDSQMAGYLMASVACLLSTKRPWRIAGLVFLFLATAMRYNAAAATLPMVILLWDTSDRPWLRRWAVATGLWIGITVLALLVNAAFVEQKSYPFQIGSAPGDIVGTIRYSPKLTDEELVRELPGVPWQHTDKIQIRARNYYAPYHSFLDVTGGRGALLRYPSTPEERDAMGAAWKKMVFSHPIAFLRHRVGVFRAQLDCRVAVWGGIVNETYAEDLLHHRHQHSTVQLAWIHFNGELVKTPLFRVVIYFVLSLMLLPLCRGRRLPGMFIVSGVLHELGLLLVAPAVDYRYSQWMVACTIIGGVLLFIERRRGPTRP